MARCPYCLQTRQLQSDVKDLSAKVQEHRAAERYILEQARRHWDVFADAYAVWAHSSRHVATANPDGGSHRGTVIADGNSEDPSRCKEGIGGDKAISSPGTNGIGGLCSDVAEVIDGRALSRTKELFARLGLGESGTLGSAPSTRGDGVASSPTCQALGSLTGAGCDEVCWVAVRLRQS